MERERKNVTIKDVAKRAGVAISTVSRVLNGLDKVSEKTQKKVRDAVEELGYVQNALAVSMVTGQTKTILMAVPDFTNDFNAAVIQGAEEALKARGYTMLIISTKDYTEEDYQLLHRRFSALVDGVLVIPSNPDVMDYTLWEKAAGSDRLLPASGRLLYGGDRECQRSLSFNGGPDQKGSSPDWVCGRNSRPESGRTPDCRLSSGTAGIQDPQ